MPTIIIVILLGIFLFLTGFAKHLFLLKVSGVIIAGLMVLIIRLIKGKINFPRYYLPYWMTLVILGISLFWTKDLTRSLEGLLLLLTGAGFWLVGFNLKKELRKHLSLIMITLGLVFGGLWGYYQYIARDLPITPYSLFGYYSNYKNHLILGDYWSGVLIILLIWLFSKPKKIWVWLLTILGVYFVIISQSRAALVGLMVGVGYLAAQGRMKYQKTLKLIGAGLIMTFLFFALSKSTLLVRDCYLQTILSLKDYPFGVGWGNFGVISKDSSYHIFGRNDFSFNTHSLVFEMISAVGFLSLMFLIWFYKVFKSVWVDKSKVGLVYRVVFIAYTVNMLFFSSYFQPTILWLWFLLLGLVI